MFFNKRLKSEDTQTSYRQEYQKTLDWIGVERDEDGNYIPFTPLRIFANAGNQTPSSRRTIFSFLEEEPGSAAMLKLFFSIAQSNGFCEQHSYWQGPFYDQFEQSSNLRKWAIELFDEDIKEVFPEVYEIRMGIWEELFANSWRGGASRMDGHNFNDLGHHEFHKYAFEMMRADLISMRACEEQGARWGIQLGFDKDGYLPLFYGFDEEHIQKYTTAKWVKYYNLGKPSWTKTSPEQMEKNRKNMLRKLNKLKKENGSS